MTNDRKGIMPRHWKLGKSALMVCFFAYAGWVSGESAPAFGTSYPTGMDHQTSGQSLTMEMVARSVTTQYPPYLAALIEQDIASGRLVSAQGSFDFNAFARIFTNPTGFYDSTTAEAGFEQFLGVWGATIYGSYRYTEGELPDYYYGRRTNEGGTPSLGIKIPLLQNGAIDTRRAAILKARLDTELAIPSIRRQHLDFTRAGMLSYVNWLTAGHKLMAAEDIYKIAVDRAAFINTQIEKGLKAPVVNLENRQMVADRAIKAAKARREFEAAAIALSLFYRDESDKPVLAGSGWLPQQLPLPGALTPVDRAIAMQTASENRPEIAIYDIEFQKLDVDTRLYKNKLLPKLNTSLGAEQSLGSQLYKDTGELEMKIGLELEVPLQRRDAKGRLIENQAKIRQLNQKLIFALQKIQSEVINYDLACENAFEQLELTRENEKLARELQDIEKDRFELGATDLLSLQIREQSAFSATLETIDATGKLLKALVDFTISTGVTPDTSGLDPEIQRRMTMIVF